MSVPWIADHISSCENAEYFRCQTCRQLVHESELNLNRCEMCLLFIPRVYDCVCEEVEKES